MRRSTTPKKNTSRKKKKEKPKKYIEIWSQRHESFSFDGNTRKKQSG